MPYHTQSTCRLEVRLEALLLNRMPMVTTRAMRDQIAVPTRFPNCNVAQHALQVLSRAAFTVAMCLHRSIGEVNQHNTNTMVGVC